MFGIAGKQLQHELDGEWGNVMSIRNRGRSVDGFLQLPCSYP